MNIYFLALGAFNLLALILYGVDKLRARAGSRRVPERNLLTLSLLGGAVGGMAAMLLFRHKIRKPYFFVVQIVSIIAHGAVILWATGHFT